MIARRLTFQLTPLLDLLLIVIFAQYMEVQQKSETAQNDLQVQKEQLQDQFSADRKKLEDEYQARKADLEKEHAEQQSAIEKTREQYSQHFESIMKQHQQAGTALADALNLPGKLLEEVLKLRTESGADGAARLEETISRMQQVLESRGEELLQFVLRYDEMEKHVSVWEIYIQDNGQASFSDGAQTSVISYTSAEEFAARAFEQSKAFTEPKPLVIILLSYGSPQAIQVQEATTGLPILVYQLRKDSGNTRWFDFSLMGYHADGPMFQKKNDVKPPVSDTDIP